MKDSSKEKTERVYASNRKASQDYDILARYEAGIVLLGSEVKSVKSARIGLAGCFAEVNDRGEVLLRNLNIPLYEFSRGFQHNPVRQRRLLLHRKEIEKLRGQVNEKGCTLIPLSLYPKHGLVKVQLAVCRGRRRGDKREALRRKTAEHEARRAMSKHSAKYAR